MSDSRLTTSPRDSRLRSVPVSPAASATAGASVQSAATRSIQVFEAAPADFVRDLERWLRSATRGGLVTVAMTDHGREAGLESQANEASRSDVVVVEERALAYMGRVARACKCAR